MKRLFVLFVSVSLVMAWPFTPVQASERAKVTFDVASNVSSEDESLIREGVRFAQDAVAEIVGGEVHGTITVRISGDAEGVASAWANAQTITFLTGHPVWLDSSPMNRVKIVTHEYFHLVQHELRGDQDPGPKWLLEGSAELIAYRSVAALGLVDFGAVMDRWVYGTLNGPVAGVPLDQMESPSPDVACCLYGVSPLAVDLLTRDKGLASVLSYYRKLRKATRPDDWKRVFKTAFGQDIESFYAAFAAYRAQIAPQGYDQTAVRYPARSTEGVGDAWFIAVPPKITSGEQVLLTAGTVAGIPCTLVITSAAGKRLLDRPAHAGPDGVVFWLWSVRTRSTHGELTAEVNCGGAPAFATLRLA